MTAKKKRGSARRTTKRAVPISQTLLRKRERELFAERQLRVQLQHEAYRPQIELLKSMLERNRSAVRKHEAVQTKLTARRRSEASFLRDQDEGAWPLVEWQPIPMARRDRGFEQPLKVVTFNPAEFGNGRLIPLKTGTGSKTIPEFPPGGPGIGCTLDAGGLGSMQVTQFFWFWLAAENTGQTMIIARCAPNGVAIARSTSGLAHIEITAELEVYPEIGPREETSGRQTYFALSRAPQFDETAYIHDTIVLSALFDRSANTNYQIQISFTFFVSSVFSHVSLDINGFGGDPPRALLYD